jgi:hypothetical protein
MLTGDGAGRRLTDGSNGYGREGETIGGIRAFWKFT